MKVALIFSLLILLPSFASSQYERSDLDSLQAALQDAVNDTVRMDIHRQLGFYFQESLSDTALRYHHQQLVLAKRLNLKLWQADAYQQIGYCYRRLDNLSIAFENYSEALKIAEDPASAANGWGYDNFSYSKSPEDARQSIVGMTHFELASLYNRSRLYKEVQYHLFEALRMGEQLQNKKILSLSNRDIGLLYFRDHKPDSALLHYQKALSHYQHSPYQRNLGTLYELLGQYYTQYQVYDTAILYFHKAIDDGTKSNNVVTLANAYHRIGGVYVTTGQLDSALSYTFRGKYIAESVDRGFDIASGLTQLALIYKLQNQNAIAYDYLEKGKTLSDSLNDAYITKLLQFQNIGFDQKIRLQDLEKASQQTKNRLRIYALLVGLGIFSLAALFLYRNNRQKLKANKVLEKTLTNLKSTQSQLIQSEKMASLGELTAGIAHEIQNPLNFVNNFSEINKELLLEMKEELDNGNVEEVKAIAYDVISNEEKIIFHGKRADAIVKGMLQHSRSSSGVKEPTDINALVDEYLRLAYHGFRAKDKSFNATMNTNFDDSIGLINIIPQDIGRVILNLMTNAFYAVSNMPPLPPKGDLPYVPTVTISTFLLKSPSGDLGAKRDTGDLEAKRVKITVSDNGPGIPPSALDKIFQPFFTTKPTGQGTGLGLSLSYDIVKAHGGELKVETKEGEGSVFVIHIPV